jgi:transposase
VRQVDIASNTDQENRRLTMLRKHAGRDRTRVINKIRQILRRHNLQWEMPTKTFPTIVAVAWLKQVVLPEIDHLEMNHLLADLEHVQQRITELEKVIAHRSASKKEVAILSSIPGMGRGFTAMSLACRVGNVERFPRAHSLANYWGLTPSCRNSGESDQRLGRITKAGSPTARWLLAQLAHKVLRKDARLREWFKRIKRRRGAGVARVAVMRKLATIIWHMLRKQKTYAEVRAAAAA